MRTNKEKVSLSPTLCEHTLRVTSVMVWFLFNCSDNWGCLCNTLVHRSRTPTMPDDLHLAEIQQAFFECRAIFKEPVTSFLYGDRQGEIIKAVQKALSPWKVGFENITWNREAKNAAELQYTFGVPSELASVQLGIVGLTINAFNPDWSRGPSLVSLFQTAVGAFKEATSQTFQSYLVTLGFHVKPGPTPFREVLRHFVNEEKLGVKDSSMYGVSVYSKDYSFVVDGSAIIPSGIFIKLIRNFGPEIEFEEMAQTLYRDEEEVLRRLGLRLQ